MLNKIIICLMAALLLTAAGCRKEQKFRIGVSQCSQDDWRAKMNDEILRQAMMYDNVEVEIRSADDSSAQQIADLEYFRDSGFDIILVAPNEAEPLAEPISEIYRSGIPVVVFDRDVDTRDYTAFQGADNYGIGRSAAEYAASLTGRHGKIIEIQGLPASTPARGRNQGFVNTLDSLYPNMEVVASAVGNWNYDSSLEAVDSLLAVYPEVDLIYAHNDRMAIAAREAADRHGLHPYIIGVDAAPAIGIRAVADSVIDATFLYPTDGYRLVNTAMSILTGSEYEREAILSIPSAVNHSNADIMLLQNEALQEETAHLGVLKSQVENYMSQYSTQKNLLIAVLIIAALLFGMLFLILKAYWQRRRYQDNLEKQNTELALQRDQLRDLNTKLSEATQSKLLFFTNVSHDLRTPLTLISEPIQQLSTSTNLTASQQTLVNIAGKNVRILQRLINQILDFRKYENGKLDTVLTEASPAVLLQEWVDSFRSVARKRDMDMRLIINLPENFTMALDVEKMERIVFNLISNALKYTPDNGRVSVCATADDTKFNLTVSDTGRGIDKEDLHHIFERFFQVDKIHPNGSGIGLSLTKAFVELMGGEITVESQPGKGSVFTVSLPIGHCEVSVAHSPARAVPGDEIEQALSPVETEDEKFEQEKPLVLVIDDNSDIRTLLTTLLHDNYNVIQAANGAEGLRMASKYIPELVICDVMMPGMDGFECCHRIKEETSTSHIPVLMLTACAADEERVNGYESGADGYLPKPFNNQVLLTRCKNLIENRKIIRNLWTGTAVERNSAPSPAENRPDKDNDFYSRFLEIFREQMADPELNVDSLAASMGLGRSQFYRKIKALTNYSPVELVRKLRLKAARSMLTGTDKSVSEISYAVGFSTPAYFTKCYREAYGETPTELRERLGK